MRNLRLACIAGLFAASGFICQLPADELWLVNGGIVEGTVTDEGTSYRVEGDTGAAMTIPKREVRKWIKKLTPMQKYAARLVQLDPENADSQMELAKWCRKNAMPDEAKYHLECALNLRPDDPAIRKAAGYIWYEKEWMTFAEKQRRRGLTKYESKWIPIEEAVTLQAEAEQKKREQEAYSEVWKLYFSTAYLSSNKSVEPTAGLIVEKGLASMGATERAAMESYPRVRETAVYVLRQFSDSRSLKLLLKRLRWESDDKLATLVSDSLVMRQDRDASLKETLEVLLQSGSSRVRKRICRTLLAMADPRAIDLLIQYIDTSPVPEQPKSATSEGADGEEESTGTDEKPLVENSEPVMSSSADEQPKQRKPFFPAYEALRYLTKEIFPIDQEVWQNWWDKNKETFVFRPAPKI